MKNLARALLLLAAAAGSPAAESAHDPLVAGFLDPPFEARPLVFWQWVNGNVTEEGIRLDLQWMKRSGIAGALMFDIGFSRPPVPQYVDRRVGFGTPAWESAVRVAATEARRLGLVLGAQSSGGWSVSGGPEVAPADGMKKLVWAETGLEAPFPRPVMLVTPSRRTGPFYGVFNDARFRVAAVEAYEDVATIAYRLPDVEQTSAPRAGLSGPPDAAALEDGSFDAIVKLTPDANADAFVVARAAAGTRLRSLTLATADAWPTGAIELSDDGVAFRTFIKLPAPAAQPSPVQTFALAVPASAWRVRFSGLGAPLAVREARFDVAARIDRVEEKAGFGVPGGPDAKPQPDEPGTAVDPHDVIDVTTHVRPDGALDWTPRSGRWRVVRFGWSLTGRYPVPATPESRGLEVDKLDAAAVRRFATSFYGRYRRAMGPELANAGGLGIALTDSWEAGQQNWTRDMLAEFRQRRGYDLRPWLPVLTGRVIGSVERSERVLADFRRTIADLISDAHYGVLADVAHTNGMTSYAEAAGTNLPTIVDGIQAKGRVDVPMGEYWYYPAEGQPDPNHLADVREAASAAHIYGRKLVAAEALTTRGEEPFAQGPRQLRRIADRFFAEGVNKIVLHTSAHQPFTDRRPGITLRQYGQHFTRNETWAEDAHAWVRYLARTSHLLQQGKPVADIAIFPGDDAPTAATFTGVRRAGYDYDLLSAEVLLRASARNGRLVLPSAHGHGGPSYRVLVRPRDARIVDARLREKLRKLAADGVPVVESGTDVAAALRAQGVAADVFGPTGGAMHWSHRVADDTDIYFVTNQSERPIAELVRFRVHGKRAEAWDAVTGAREMLRYAALHDATDVDLDLGAYESRFIVFRGPALVASGAPALTAAIVRSAFGRLATLEGPWDVEFIDRADVARLQMPRLVSWTESEDTAIRYYSGRARYRREFAVRPEWLNGRQHIELALGNVAELAHVFVNGRDLGVSWTQPDRVDVTDALTPGSNRLEIVVTNYWANRMIGDLQPGATPLTFAPISPFTATSPLRPAGLLGPVQLLRRTE